VLIDQPEEAEQQHADGTDEGQDGHPAGDALGRSRSNRTMPMTATNRQDRDEHDEELLARCRGREKEIEEAYLPPLDVRRGSVPVAVAGTDRGGW
jgi:hypothetical protein